MQQRFVGLLVPSLISSAAALGCSPGGGDGNNNDGGANSGGATSGTGQVAGNPSTSGTVNGTAGSGFGTAGSGFGTAGTSTGTAGSSTGTAGSNSSMGGSVTNPSGGASGMATGTAGSTTGTAGSTTGTGGAPMTGGSGYWTSKDWHGCAWTGKGEFGTTSIMPMDFVAKAAGAAYCIQGTVGAEPMYRSVALLGFNVNEPAGADCAYKPVDPTKPGPPTAMAMADGIAVNFVKQGASTAFTLRVQIQGPNGAMAGPVGEADRWCATITEVQGKVFVPYSAFTPKCWELTPALRGTPYAKQAISAVVFTVPGTVTDTPYNFCVNGLAYGTSAADAPDGSAVGGDQTGVVGGMGSMDLDFARAKVNVGGENYIIQNNNWGNPTGTDLILSYRNNSFKITNGTGSGGDAPASFPSIYIGNNGNTANGNFSTSTTDNLPAQISAITSIPSTFRYSGTTTQWNAAYDIWFANSPPTMPYNDGINGFVMIWLRDPSGKVPIGTLRESNVMIAGQPWNVWVGPRGNGPAGPNNAPVVSYVNPAEDNDSRSQSFKNVDIKAFIAHAAAHGIAPTMYLTDVFAGFEIWQGGFGPMPLSVDEFTAVVNK